MRIIPMHGAKARGRHLFVSSDADYDQLMGYRWFVEERRRPGGGIKGPYARAYVPGSGRAGQKYIYAHVLLMGEPGIDHRNGYGLDCTRRNMRKATTAQNGRNTGPRGGSSGYIGVSWDRRRWRAEVKAEGTRWYQRFTTEIDAARARDAMACEWHGAFARFNFAEEHRNCHGGTCSAVQINPPRP